jgi:hypothetical protein
VAAVNRLAAVVKRPAGLVAVALVVLGAGWAIAPRSALPLYDGIGFPDEPYRFVQRPASAPETKPPTTAHASASVKNGQVGSIVAASGEVAPQITVYVPKGRLVAPTGATGVTITGQPVRNLPTSHGEYLWSDVYTVSASPSGTTFNSGGQQATITLRAAAPQRPIPHIAFYEGNGRWALLPTFAQGQDIYIAELTRFGQFAVIGDNPLLVTQLPGGGAGKKGSGSGSAVGLLVAIGAGAFVALLFVLGQVRRARLRAQAESDADGLDQDGDHVRADDVEEAER